jgi:hypothetical protein
MEMNQVLEFIKTAKKEEAFEDMACQLCGNEWYNQYLECYYTLVSAAGAYGVLSVEEATNLRSFEKTYFELYGSRYGDVERLFKGNVYNQTILGIVE